MMTYHIHEDQNMMTYHTHEDQNNDKSSLFSMGLMVITLPQ